MDSSFANRDFSWILQHVPPWKRRIKRAIDFGVSLMALIFFFPVFVLIALLVKLAGEGPAFFSQERVGYLGKTFHVHKFRTMVKDALKRGGYETSEQDPRITPLGRFLRRWSLDELPQLWNVFKGEMSLIGPRPTLAYQVDAYTAQQRRRLLVKPGMSGLAQVSGRNALTWPERIELDLQYIENFSFWLDAKIFFRSFGLVLGRKGVYGDKSL